MLLKTGGTSHILRRKIDDLLDALDASIPAILAENGPDKFMEVFSREVMRIEASPEHDDEKLHVHGRINQMLVFRGLASLESLGISQPVRCEPKDYFFPTWQSFDDWYGVMWCEFHPMLCHRLGRNPTLAEYVKDARKNYNWVRSHSPPDVWAYANPTMEDYLQNVFELEREISCKSDNG